MGKGDDCPCTPMATFVAETEGRFNVIEEKFHRHADKVKHLATDMTKSAAQMKAGVTAILQIQAAVEKQNLLLDQGREKFGELKGWLKKLTYSAAGLVAFILLVHGDDAWALIKLLL